MPCEWLGPALLLVAVGVGPAAVRRPWRARSLGGPYQRVGVPEPGEHPGDVQVGRTLSLL